MKETCDKCKKELEDLWLSSTVRPDGSTKEQWFCSDCMLKKHPNFQKVLDFYKKLETENF